MVSVEDLLRHAEQLGVKLVEHPLPKGYCGFYLHPQRIICLDSGLSQRQYLCTLQHELIHAEFRDDGCSPTGKPELRARRETASRLIDLREYAACENEYSNDLFHIALELDVTKQVIEDYRELVLPKMIAQQHNFVNSR
ncbi:hypothetical protein BPY_20990 [Bifidobacterium psychraerophilum]|uniref:ImmA/IrrE family metallo-endopeptidase n=1 Tax=Bifidobacterium psychraerophilum TaxID=218140 RepID=UPI003115A6CD